MRKTKKILLSLGLLLFAVATLATSTFAWFTINQNAQVEQLELGVVADRSLEISLDPSNPNSWSNKLTGAQILASRNDLKLTAISTQDLNTFYASYVTDSNDPRYQLGVANKDYLSVDIYFRIKLDANDDDVDDLDLSTDLNGLYLTSNVNSIYANPTDRSEDYNTFKNNKIQGTYTVSKGRDWKIHEEFIWDAEDDDFQENDATNVKRGNALLNETPLADQDQNKYYAADALRIAIKEANDFVAGDSRAAEDLAKFIYDPSEDEHRGYAHKYGQFDYLKKYADPLLKAPKAADNPDNETNESFKSIKNKLTLIGDAENGKNAQDNETLCATFIDGGDHYAYAKITLIVWLEGWDADCLNAIFADDILMQLYFVAANKKN